MHVLYFTSDSETFICKFTYIFYWIKIPKAADLIKNTVHRLLLYAQYNKLQGNPN